MLPPHRIAYCFLTDRVGQVSGHVEAQTEGRKRAGELLDRGEVTEQEADAKAGKGECKEEADAKAGELLDSGEVPKQEETDAKAEVTEQEHADAKAAGEVRTSRTLEDRTVGDQRLAGKNAEAEENIAERSPSQRRTIKGGKGSSTWKGRRKGDGSKKQKIGEAKPEETKAELIRCF